MSEKFRSQKVFFKLIHKSFENRNKVSIRHYHIDPDSDSIAYIRIDSGHSAIETLGFILTQYYNETSPWNQIKTRIIMF